jgi:hypothetical protein
MLHLLSAGCAASGRCGRWSDRFLRSGDTSRLVNAAEHIRPFLRGNCIVGMFWTGAALFTVGERQNRGWWLTLFGCHTIPRKHCQRRNRRAMNHRSHPALIPLDKLFTSCDDLLVYTPKPSADYAQSEQALENPTIVSLLQRRPGPDVPQWKIPLSEWPNVVRRIVENQESLRKVARDYGVSYETIRRVVRVANKRQKPE